MVRSGRAGRLDRVKPQGRSLRTSFTLIEVLLALSLTGLLVAVTGRIAVQVVLTRQEVTRSISQLEREAYVLERLSADFASMLQGLPGDETPLMVFGTQRQVLQLSVLSPIPGSDDSLHLIRRPATVRYRLVGAIQDVDGLELIRETIDLTERSAYPVRETVATGMISFEMEVLCGAQWTPKYPQHSARPAAAVAVRVSCRWANSRQAPTWTFVIHDQRPAKN